jgi:hypothetical protein
LMHAKGSVPKSERSLRFGARRVFKETPLSGGVSPYRGVTGAQSHRPLLPPVRGEAGTCSAAPAGGESGAWPGRGGRLPPVPSVPPVLPPFLTNPLILEVF